MVCKLICRYHLPQHYVAKLMAGQEDNKKLISNM